MTLFTDTKRTQLSVQLSNSSGVVVGQRDLAPVLELCQFVFPSRGSVPQTLDDLRIQHESIQILIGMFTHDRTLSGDSQ